MFELVSRRRSFLHYRERQNEKIRISNVEIDQLLSITDSTISNDDYLCQANPIFDLHTVVSPYHGIVQSAILQMTVLDVGNWRSFDFQSTKSTSVVFNESVIQTGKRESCKRHQVRIFAE